MVEMCPKKIGWLLVMYGDNDKFDIIKVDRIKRLEGEEEEALHRYMSVTVDGRKAVIAALSDTKKRLLDGYCMLTDEFRVTVKKYREGFQPTKCKQSNVTLSEMDANKAGESGRTPTDMEKEGLFYKLQYEKIRKERDHMKMYFEQRYPELVKKFASWSISNGDETISNKENNPKVVICLGPNETKVPAAELRNFKWGDMRKVIRGLLDLTFGKDVLAKSSLTGNRSPCFRDRKPKPALDPNIVEDIVYFITKKYDVKSRKEITDIITTKCADECKLSKKLYKKRSSKRGMPKKKSAKKTV